MFLLVVAKCMRKRVVISLPRFHPITNSLSLSLSLLIMLQNAIAEMSSNYECEGEIFSDGIARKVMA